MENWLKHIFLISLAAVSVNSFAQDDEQPNDDVLEKIITPDLERRVIEEDKLDNEDFEIGGYFGLYSFEDFGTNAVVGVSVAYHVSESFFMELNYGQSTLGESSYERLSLPLLTEDEREMSYYNVSIGWNTLPGEVYLFGRAAFNTSFYFNMGGGATQFADDWHNTISLGGGMRWALTDWMAMHFDAKVYSLAHTVFSEEIPILNLETRMGLTIFF